MATPVIINTAAIQYASGTTECHCAITATSVVGTEVVMQVVALDSTTLADDWTDADLCAAVAAQLNIPAADVSVAVAPTPAPVVDTQGVGSDTPVDG
jgi:hypothetical protein